MIRRLPKKLANCEPIQERFFVRFRRFPDFRLRTVRFLAVRRRCRVFRPAFLLLFACLRTFLLTILGMYLGLLNIFCEFKLSHAGKKTNHKPIGDIQFIESLEQCLQIKSQQYLYPEK